MRTIWLVIKHDVGATLRQPSFWLLTFLVPALLIGYLTYSTIRYNQPDTEADRPEESASTPADIQNIGLVDEPGLLAEPPSGFPPDLFLRFQDQATARAALEAGEIEQYVHIPADYVATGQVTVYDQNFQILQSGEDMGVAFHSESEWVLGYLLNYSLTRDEELVTALRNPTPGALAEWHALRPPEETDADSQALAELVSTIVPYGFYFLLLMSSSYLMRAVVAEKENRTVEVLLLSVDPRKLMVGKILAMSMVALLQVVVWVGGGVLILDRGADLLRVAEFTFPPGFLVWATLFLVVGYLLFASVMTAAGALATNAREGGQMMWLLVIPLMPTLMFSSMFLEDPNHPLVLGLSLFPLSAPSAMVTRLAVAPVPVWQILISLAGVALTAYLFIALAGRFFRAGNLLSDASFSWQRLATGWRR
jgi:ABC-2 type transport system permease protein